MNHVESILDFSTFEIYSQKIFSQILKDESLTMTLSSEKTLFAMLAGQIPIIIGYPGIVSDCINMGFDMFCDIVDVSYDWADDSVRWKLALESNQDLILNTPGLEKLQDRLTAQRHYVLVEWPEKLLADFKEQIAAVACCLTNS